MNTAPRKFAAGAGQHQLRKFRSARAATSRKTYRNFFRHPDRAVRCNAGQRRGTIAPKAKAPVCEDTLSEAVAAPTDKRGFVMSKFLGLVRLHQPSRFRAGWGYPQGHPHGFGRVFQHPAHLLRLKPQTVALVTPDGAKTMHQTTLASRCAAPNTQATTEETRAFALLQATSDAAMAKLYLDKGNIAAARRKAVQLLKALQVLEVSQ